MNDDTSHLPGETVNDQGLTPPATKQNPVVEKDDTAPPTINQMSSAYMKQANDIASDDTSIIYDPLTGLPVSSDAKEQQNQQTGEASSLNSTSPSVQGEQSVSGDMPDPESDDDTLVNAQQVGTQLEEDSENPKELNIGADIDKAEQAIRES